VWSKFAHLGFDNFDDAGRSARYELRAVLGRTKEHWVGGTASGATRLPRPQLPLFSGKEVPLGSQLHQLPWLTSPWLRPVARLQEDRLVKNWQPLLPEPWDLTPQELLHHKDNYYLGNLRYELVATNGQAFCRAGLDFPELYDCPVEPEYFLPARLLTPHHPYSRPDWFGVAQVHAGFQYPDPSHWSQR
jgi:hypothetical protein